MQISLDALQSLIATAFENSKVAPDTAQIVAKALVRAEADGISSHGVARVPPYAEQAKCGKVDGFAKPTLDQPRPSVINVDSHIGFAFPAVELGLREGIKAAREAGMAAIGIAHSHHFGAAGHHVEDAADAGLVALAFSNTPSAIAPWGGSRALYGTNPIAFAWPRSDSAPMVIDLSVSTVARGKVTLAAKAGEPIPSDWAFDADGNPTTDAKAALAGSMAPLGGAGAGAKGAALALMIELLCGALTGSNFGYQGTSFFEPTGAPPSIGHMILLFDPAAFGGADSFGPRAEELFGEILAQDGARLPGDRRLKLRETAARDGVDIPDDLLDDIKSRAS
tara:strand:+ start:1784 stop:2794 length:1011 start_codon:yes stop_codon:yes gene_type:complete